MLRPQQTLEPPSPIADRHQDRNKTSGSTVTTPRSALTPIPRKNLENCQDV
ncbi:MAG: hypothetical protein HC860_11995 [Alkalinema sp. RU_4_3]|nr:hypothetical protein [Alkalinema sp. RU_4_3]